MDKILRFCPKAIIEKDGKILILKTSEVDPSPFNWEVPGGGINWGEDIKVGFIREIKEELGIDFEITIGDSIYIASWVHPYHRDLAYAVWAFYVCKYKSGKIALSGEHIEHKWINPKDYKEYPMISIVRKALEKYNQIKK